MQRELPSPFAIVVHDGIIHTVKSNEQWAVKIDITHFLF
jgi:glutamate synthase domain-containing protein 1